MKVLIIQTAFIGDVVLATPLVEQLQRRYPEAQIDFMLRKGNEKLLLGHPHIHRLWIWDKKKEKYGGMFRLIRGIRQEHYDWVINCQRFAASGLITALSGAGGKAGFDKNPFSFLFDRKVPHRFGTADQPIHEVQRNLALIEHLTEIKLERPHLYPSAADFHKAAGLSSDLPYVCMAPTSVWFTKQFPAHKWVELIRRIPADQLVFLLGGPDDAAACTWIAEQSAHPGVRNVCGQLSFLESAALMKSARLNYVNDSAPMHIASAVNAPVLAVFCSTIPAFGFTPLSDDRQIVEVAELLDCRPCGLHGFKACPKGHFNCAENIGVETIEIR